MHWNNFIAELSIAAETEPNCIQQCLSCSCCAVAADLQARMNAISAKYSPLLGAIITQRVYHYQAHSPTATIRLCVTCSTPLLTA